MFAGPLASALRTLGSSPIWAPIALGTAVRIVWILLCPNQPFSDQIIYHAHAVDIAAGKGYVDSLGQPAAYWPVGYSALLAGFYILLGAEPSSAFVANLLLSVVTSLGAFALGKAWFNGATARIAVWWLALHPTLILFTTCIASENAFFAGTVWFAVLATHTVREAGLRVVLWGALTGTVAALTGYVRPTIVLLSPLAVALGFANGLRLPSIAARTLLIGVFSVVVLLPWTLRNLEHFGELQPFSFNGKANLWMGNHEGGDGGYATLPKHIEPLPLPERERILGELASRFIFEDPARYAALCVRRAVTTLKSDTVAAVWNRPGLERRLGAGAEAPLKVVTTVHHWLMWAIVASALVISLRNSLRRRRWELESGERLVLVALVLLAVPFVFIVSGNRYHLPLIPFGVLYASNALRRGFAEPQLARST